MPNVDLKGLRRKVEEYFATVKDEEFRNNFNAISEGWDMPETQIDTAGAWEEVEWVEFTGPYNRHHRMRKVGGVFEYQTRGWSAIGGPNDNWYSPVDDEEEEWLRAVYNDRQQAREREERLQKDYWDRAWKAYVDGFMAALTEVQNRQGYEAKRAIAEGRASAYVEARRELEATITKQETQA